MPGQMLPSSSLRACWDIGAKHAGTRGTGDEFWEASVVPTWTIYDWTLRLIKLDPGVVRLVLSTTSFLRARPRGQRGGPKDWRPEGRGEVQESESIVTR